MNRGFTVVEVLVTLIIIAIILGLGTVGLRSTLANGRDAERRSDIETIARSLEVRYDRGNLKESTTFPPGTYPSSAEIMNGPGWNGNYTWQEILPGISDAALTSPSGEWIDAFCTWFFWNASCTAAEIPANIAGRFTNPDGTFRDKYVYEFVGENGGYCDWQACVRYNLYWISEVDKSTSLYGIPGLKVYRSKHS